MAFNQMIRQIPDENGRLTTIIPAPQSAVEDAVEGINAGELHFPFDSKMNPESRAELQLLINDVLAGRIPVRPTSIDSGVDKGMSES